MTSKDFSIKWLAYALALAALWVVDAFLLSRIPVFGVRPMLLPLAGAAVAVLEGSAAGAGFGMAVGALFGLSHAEPEGLAILLFSFVGLVLGLLAEHILRQDLSGCLICALLALAAVDGVRILTRLLNSSAPMEAMLTVVGREILLSLCFVPPVYLLFRWVFRRVPKATVL